jgi:hypothetical protein
MSANPKDERRALRQRMGSRMTRRANTKFGKNKAGENKPYRASPATQMKALTREAGLR